MRYSLQVYDDIFDRWDLVVSSNHIEVVQISFIEHKKKHKRKHFRIIEVLERC